ncbi:DUF4167 domain-containing protein [Sphingobium sufflavum]|nr:DUF4167 domain-containing protein [Sphingobium sufflavum]MCE7794933.1 DUF4167 domain-containing protein [Sphingobium sufflavum]
MINNRQAGRRRGRNNNNNNGGPRQNGGGNRGNGDSGNRIDNRARGNAAQLLEKYRNMARDAQLAGDRVNMEYYLQFADHYFRVLADNRARQEEQQGGQQGQRFQRFDASEQDEEFGSDDDGLGDLPEIGGRQRDDFRRENPRDANRDDNRNEDVRRDDNRREEARGNRDDNRGNREDSRNNRDDNRGNRDETRVPREGRRPARERAPVQQDDVRAETAPQDVRVERAVPAPSFADPANDEGREEPRPRVARGRKPRREVEASETQEVGLDAAVLPPAIGRPAPVADAGDDVEPAAPVRRTRRPRATPAQAAE